MNSNSTFCHMQTIQNSVYLWRLTALSKLRSEVKRKQEK